MPPHGPPHCSPFGHISPARPVGPIITGMDSFWPNSFTDKSRCAAPLSGRGQQADVLESRFVAAQGPFILGPAIDKIKHRARQHAPGLGAHGLNAVATPTPAFTHSNAPV